MVSCPQNKDKSASAFFSTRIQQISSIFNRVSTNSDNSPCAPHLTPHLDPHTAPHLPLIHDKHTRALTLAHCRASLYPCYCRLLRRDLGGGNESPLTSRAPRLALAYYKFLEQRMSKKDYERIARVFRIYRPPFPEQHQWYMDLLYSLLRELQEDNPRFDANRFLEAVDA